MQVQESFSVLLQENPALKDHCHLMLSSYQRLLGKPLIDDAVIQKSGLEALFDAEFGLLSHDTQVPPVFNYGNRLALQLFERPWKTFVQMPSRQSAEQDERAERERLLKAVNDHGYIEDYKGIRISASGQRFYIDKTTVWNLIDEAGIYRGQAAAIFRWQPINGE